MIRSMRSRQLLTVWCMTSRQTAIKCQASITLFREKAIQKKKILGAFISSHIPPEVDQHLS